MGAEHFDVEIVDQGKPRTVRVIITVPAGQNFLHLGEIAQRAWDSPEKRAFMGGAIAKIDMRKR